ncbi:MAG: phosphoribosylpyrophosphate synthetase [Ignavibacteria bacterium]
MKTYETLSEALDDLNKRGYVHNFNIECDSIECKSLSLKLHPNEFEITEFYRFEGDSNPGDEEVVYAITSADGIKGTLVDAYGAYSGKLTEELLQKLKIDRP